jgi:hypothetical protein
MGKPVDQGNDWALGIGADQLKSDAKRDHSFEDPEQQPDQLGEFKSKDALFASGFAL